MAFWFAFQKFSEENNKLFSEQKSCSADSFWSLFVVEIASSFHVISALSQENNFGLISWYFKLNKLPLTSQSIQVTKTFL